MIILERAVADLKCKKKLIKNTWLVHSALVGENLTLLYAVLKGWKTFEFIIISAYEDGKGPFHFRPLHRVQNAANAVRLTARIFNNWKGRYTAAPFPHLFVYSSPQLVRLTPNCGPFASVVNKSCWIRCWFGGHNGTY